MPLVCWNHSNRTPYQRDRTCKSTCHSSWSRTPLLAGNGGKVPRYSLETLKNRESTLSSSRETHHRTRTHLRQALAVTSSTPITSAEEELIQTYVTQREWRKMATARPATDYARGLYVASSGASTALWSTTTVTKDTQCV